MPHFLVTRFFLKPILLSYLFSSGLWVNSIVYAEDFFSSASTVHQEINTILTTKKNPLLARANFEYRAEEVEVVYSRNNNELFWLNNAQTEKNVGDVLALLSNAAAEGLNPEDYSLSVLKQKFPLILLHQQDSPADLAAYDTAITISLVRFLHDIHYGRVSPHSLNFSIKLRTQKTLNVPEIIQLAVTSGNILQLVSNAEPKLQQYQQLRSALATYRELAINVQTGHDKKNKLSNLQSRIAKISLAMERLRWLPELNAGKSIMVNIPAFQLWGVDSDNNQSVHLKVVVGKAQKNQTPVLMADMRYIEFMPYWNVPPSIFQKEIWPKLSVNPNYLAGQNMEVVSLKNGKMRVRQRPGGKNALGRLKFIFPNPYGVYLHDTPSKSLFNRSRRDFSHGCVRVQHPEDLARFVLGMQEGWTQERITSNLSNNEHHQTSLKTSIPVLFFYSTAFYEKNDVLAFYDDIYGYDAPLLAALSRVEDAPETAFIAAQVPEKINEPSSTPILEPDDSQLFSVPSPTLEPLSP
ncbi:MAG: L,D-transpeptidase YcbB [Pseudomonadota bacterium]|nr:L,D-transpeptidase YcbB [Pseudomonadota bacterium]